MLEQNLVIEEQPALEKFNFKEYDFEDLVDIRDVKIDINKPVQEKILDFIMQIKNPYFFKVGDVAVKVNFDNNGASFQEKFQNFLKTASKK